MSKGSISRPVSGQFGYSSSSFFRNLPCPKRALIKVSISVRLFELVSEAKRFSSSSISDFKDRAEVT